MKYNLFVLDAVIDFEKSPAIDIKVQVTDRGGLSLKKNFTVRVEDVNEKPTQISLSQNKVIIENHKINVGFFLVLMSLCSSIVDLVGVFLAFIAENSNFMKLYT